MNAQPDALGLAPADERQASRPRPSRRRLAVRLVVTVLLLGLVFGGLYGFDQFRAKKIAEFFANNKPPPTPVAMVTATSQSVPKFFTAIGTLAAVRQVMVSPEVGGRVTQIFFEAGGRTRAGEPLAQINDRTEQADLAAQQAQARLAELNLKRSRELLSRQAAAQATVDQQQAVLDEIRANIQKTQALIAQKLVRAPFDGELGIRQLDVGQYLSPGAPVVTLTDLSKLHVNFTLPEQTRSQLAVGQAVQVSSDAYPGRAFDAKITTIEPQVSAETRSIKVQATMDNPDRLLLPGMFADVRVVLPPQPDAVTVPETAIDYTLYGDSVFLIRAAKDEAGDEVLHAERTPVKAGDRFAGRVVILSGVKPGDRVAASGQIRLLNGAAVTVSPTDSLNPPAAVPRY